MSEMPIEEYVEKIQYACSERDRIDRNFLIIARTDSCRFFGVEEAVKRVNAAAKVGADEAFDHSYTWQLHPYFEFGVVLAKELIQQPARMPGLGKKQRMLDDIADMRRLQLR